jgi:hypothetical protein
MSEIQALSPEILEPDLEPGEVPLEVEESVDTDEESQDWDSISPPDRKLVTQPYDLAVSELVSQIDRGDLVLNPVYQRRYVWDDDKASKLIESLLINVPIPVIYLAEESDGTRSTIDGQQRLRSIYRFAKNEFPISGAEVLSEINGKRFFELTQREQRLINKRAIRAIVIGDESHPDIRFDVFERLNTGSVALRPQEIRNSAYRGSFNDLLHELADHETFRLTLSNRANTRMTSEELVLRFFALDERLLDYRPTLKSFLNGYMRDNRRADGALIDAKRDRFAETISRVYAVFGGNAFRRASTVTPDISWVPQINSALFDVVMLNFARLPNTLDEIEAGRDEIVQMTAELIIEDSTFADAISRATGDRARLFRRVAMFGLALAARGFDSGLAEALPDSSVE